MIKLVVFWQGCEPLYRHHLEFGKSKRHVCFPMLIYQRRIKRVYSIKKKRGRLHSLVFQNFRNIHCLPCSFLPCRIGCVVNSVPAD